MHDRYCPGDWKNSWVLGALALPRPLHRGAGGWGVRGGIEIHVYAPALNISQSKFKQGIVNSKQWYVQCNIALYNTMTTQYHTIPIKMRRGLLQVPGSARRGSMDLKHRRAGAASLANPSGLCPHSRRPRRSTISYCYTTWYETKWAVKFAFGVMRSCKGHWNQMGPLRAVRCYDGLSVRSTHWSYACPRTQ